MAGTKEIRRRIGSVKSTRKITAAMKLVSAAKLKRAQEAVQRTRQYSDAVNRMLAELLGNLGDSDFTHPLMEKRENVNTIRVLVVGGNRGLCGGYNTNLNKRIESFVKEISATHPNAKLEFVLLGRKPAEYFRRVRREAFKTYEDLLDDPNKWPLDEVCDQTEIDFVEGKIDQVYVIFTKFKSALSSSPMVEKLIPFEAPQQQEIAVSAATIFEPSVAQVFNAIVPRIMRIKLRQACLDAKASEHGNRMAAMDSATKNAGDLVDSLTLLYNKLRQANITGELLDIVGGAEALK